MKTLIRYVLITPARNEAEYLEHTIRSMIAQTMPPTLWIIVNDGSSDETAGIIDRWAARISWIVPIHLPDHTKNKKQSATAESRMGRGQRARQAKEIEAFYEGYREVGATDWDFLVKLDGDVSFEPDYFENCFDKFSSELRLGIGGGAISNLVDGQLQFEATQAFHVRGATKIYRRACWDEIGGVLRGAGWDTIDEVKANMLGWETRTFPELKVIHHRYTGAANGMWHNAVKNGIWSYICGYHPLFITLKCAKRLVKKPFLVGSAGLFFGYLLGFLQGVPQIEDRNVIRYLRQQQLRRLCFRDSIWR